MGFHKGGFLIRVFGGGGGGGVIKEEGCKERGKGGRVLLPR